MSSELLHLYFAYGSNLNTEQMRVRCPGSRVKFRGWLLEHRLTFGSFSRNWGGAVATVIPALGERVPGLIYEITEQDLLALDRFESYPHQYERKLVGVHADQESGLSAITYYLHAGSFVPGEPSERYVGVIEAGYQRLGFDVRLR